MAGVRPKVQSPGSPIQDFIICHEKERGLNHFINLIGIESPGLTSCLSLAAMITDMVKEGER
jgi:L-2-hydroxyglutarate oxidase LhgO